MALEVRFNFNEKDKAVAFQRFLRKKNCDARITKIAHEENDIEFRGTLAAYNTLVERTTANLSEEDPNREFKEKAIEYLKQFILKVREIFTQFYAQHQEGDSISEPGSSNIPNLFREWQKNDFFANETKAEIVETLQKMFVIAVLIDNGVISRTDTGFKIIKILPVDDIVVPHNQHHLENLNASDVLEAGISAIRRITISNQYLVDTGISTVYIDSEDLHEYIDECGGVFDDFVDNIVELLDRKILVSKIITALRSGCTSLDEIMESVKEPIVPQDELDGDYPLVFSIDEEYLEQVLADMKKLELISTKNGVYKLRFPRQYTDISLQHE